MAVAVERLDLLADEARFLLGIPGPGEHHPLARFFVGAQGLAEPPLVVGDQVGGGCEDVSGRPVIAFQPHHGGAGKVVLEAQDVVHLRPAPAVDRLVVVSDAGEVGAFLRQQAKPEILRDVGILVLVHQHVAEALVIGLEHVRVVAEQAQAFQQQIAEIGGVERLQPFLVGRVERDALTEGEGRGLALGHLVGMEPAVLPVVDHAGELARRPALLVDVAVRRDHLLEKAHLVVHAEDGEVAREVDEFGVAAQDARGNGVEGAEPGHPLGDAADEGGDTLLHLAGGLVGEGHRQDLRGPGLAGGEQVGDPRGEHACLAGAGAGEHE